MQKGACFTCKKQGHWANDCPDKQLNKPMSSSTSPPTINCHAVPERQCPVCGGTCLFRTSHTEKNPGRKFYNCPDQFGKNCKFFEWYDQASPDKRQYSPPTPKPHLMRSDQRQDTPLSSYPECACGAGTCKLLTVDTEENNGRKYFACPVQKGQGACNFRQWQNYYMDKNKNIHSPTLTFNSSEEKKLIHQDAKKDININDLSGIISPVPTVKRMLDFSSRGYQVKEDIVGSNSGLDDDLLPSSGVLKLNEKKTTTVVAKPGNCYRCGKEGHWMQDCLQTVNSPCFKCGKIGHWMKDCNT